MLNLKAIKNQLKRFSFHKSLTLVRPIFIVGTVRSGTTLLAKCLGEHPLICHPRQRHFELTPEWCELGNIDIAAAITSKHNCPPVNESAVTTSVRQKLHKGFSQIMLEEGCQNNSRFLNKNPHLWNKLPFVHKVFPDANLIITSRDIYSSVASIKNLFIDVERRHGVKHYLPTNNQECWSLVFKDSSNQQASARTFPGGDVSVIAEYWLRVYQALEENAGKFNVAMLVKHRDFVENAEVILSEIYENVDLPKASISLKINIDKSRNNLWHELLNSSEKNSLESFIEKNYNQIKALKYADTYLK